MPEAREFIVLMVIAGVLTTEYLITHDYRCDNCLERAKPYTRLFLTAKYEIVLNVGCCKIAILLASPHMLEFAVDK